MKLRLTLTWTCSLLLCATAAANNFTLSGPGGAIPDCPASPGAWNVAPGWPVFTSTVNVLDPVNSITKVRLSGLQHGNRGDLHVFLTDPNGVRHNLIVRPGWNGTTGGDVGNYNLGAYDIVQSGGGTFSQGATNIIGGSYNQFLNSGGGMWTSGSYVIGNASLSSITGPAGVWTLTVVDWWNLNVGSLTGWTLEGTDTTDPGMMYWASNVTNTIHRANLDGTGEQDLLLNISTAVTGAMALDLQGAKIYWARPVPGRIWRANLDGTSPQDLLLDISAINNGNIQLDVPGGKLYWASEATDTIHRANLDGTSEEDLLLPIDASNDKTLTLELLGGKMYWCSNATSTIHRANLDGTSDQDLLLGLNLTSEITVDGQGGKIYWCPISVNLHRANLDGTSVQNLLLSMNNLNGNTTLDVPGGKIYWAANNTSTIHRANLDGTSDQNLLLSIDEDNNGEITLDLQRGKMYWASDITSTIHRANLDGTGDQDLLKSINPSEGNIYLALPEPPMVQSCFPGTSGVIACPCGQPANPVGGCANFGAGATTGARLNAIGIPSVSADTVVLTTSNHRSPAQGVLNVFFSFKLGGPTPTSGVPAGAGVRCIGAGGYLKRLYTVQVFGGTGSKPGPGDPSISSLSASFPANQHTIVPPETRHYFNVYRDGQAAGPCGNTASSTNLTNMGAILWIP